MKELLSSNDPDEVFFKIQFTTKTARVIVLESFLPRREIEKN